MPKISRYLTCLLYSIGMVRKNQLHQHIFQEQGKNKHGYLQRKQTIFSLYPLPGVIPCISICSIAAFPLIYLFAKWVARNQTGVREVSFFLKTAKILL